jgi:hypothetical protein
MVVLDSELPVVVFRVTLREIGGKTYGFLQTTGTCFFFFCLPRAPSILAPVQYPIYNQIDYS